jgi:crossover junction endodeoxyribonuclease RuvC
MEHNIVIGIDPGKKGGVAVLMNGTLIMLQPLTNENLKMALHGAKAAAYAYEELNRECRLVAFVEKVGARPGQGVTSMFHFGENYGFVQGMLYANEIETVLVTPQTWKKHFCLINCEKDESVAVCKEHFPAANLIPPRKRKEQDGLAEAALIALYGYRTIRDEERIAEYKKAYTQNTTNE